MARRTKSKSPSRARSRKSPRSRSSGRGDENGGSDSEDADMKRALAASRSTYRDERTKRRTTPRRGSRGGKTRQSEGTGLHEVNGELAEVHFKVPRTRSGISNFANIVGWLFIFAVLPFAALPPGISLDQVPILGNIVPRNIATRIFGLPDNALFGLSLFWRFAYNLGIGLLLHWQSKISAITRFVRSARRSRLLKPIVDVIVSTSLPDHKGVSGALDAYPLCFTAWVFTQNIINVVLPNDVVCFCLVAYRCYLRTDPDMSSFQSLPLFAPFASELSLEALYWFRVAAIVIGLALMALSCWGKYAAHKTLADVGAWHWADFFFRFDNVELTFDGIFELVPHAMYSVGYAWMYGLALLCWSWDVLALALASHITQMLFLVLVEQPHIEKLYSSPKSIADVARWNSKHRANVMVIKNFDVLRPGDWMTAFNCISIAAVTLLMPREAAVYFTVAVRIFGTLFLGIFLRKQWKTKFWTSLFLKRGLSAEKAFESWIRIYNFIDTSMNVTLLSCCVRYFQPLDFVALWRMHGGGVVSAYLLTAISFVWISKYALDESYTHLGDYGWCYGDFFLTSKAVYTKEGLYSGLYRYVTNPDVNLGKLWMYAIVIVCRSKVVGALVVLSHATFYLLLTLVEKPHMREMLGSVDGSSPLRKHSTMISEKLHAKFHKVRERFSSVDSIEDVLVSLFRGQASRGTRFA